MVYTVGADRKTHYLTGLGNYKKKKSRQTVNTKTSGTIVKGVKPEKQSSSSRNLPLQNRQSIIQLKTKT